MTSNIQSRVEKNQLARVAKRSFIILGATGFGLGLNYLYTIFLARTVGANDFGLYVLGLGVFNILSTVSVAGLDSATLRFLSAAMASGDHAIVRSTLRVLIALSLIFGGVIGLILLLGGSLISDSVFHASEAAPILGLFALGIPAFATSSVLIAALQAFHDISWRTTVKYICEPLSRFGLTALFLWLGWTIWGAALSFVIALLFSAFFCVIPLRAHLKVAGKREIHRLPIRSVLGFSLPLLLSLLFASVATRSDILILGYWTDPEQVGIYGAAFQTASILILTLGALESIATPLLSHSIAQADHAELERLYKTILRWSLTLALPLFLSMVLYSKELLVLFGTRFESGAIPLSILAFGQIFNAATASTHHVLVLKGHSKIVMWNSMCVGILQVVLHMWLIPLYGIHGAALATSSAIVIMNLVRLIQSKILMGLQPFESMVWKPLMAGLVCWILSIALAPWASNLAPLLIILVLITTYAALILAFGLAEEDLVILLRARNMVRTYVGLAVKY